ncbi:MAG: hypothetical protein FI672_00910 [SAR202 cluster bacterium]|nr:hypothetical protein [SAR202 cluster bacterium]|tara:strand:- start:69 stop:314 length:246 start_codon:yes stop_codon:yes gene_type:complete
MNNEINREIDPLEEYNMILHVLSDAHDSAVKLKDQISEFMLKCEQAKHLKIPNQQLQDMQLEPQVKYLQLHLEFILNRLKK